MIARKRTLTYSILHRAACGSAAVLTLCLAGSVAQAQIFGTEDYSGAELFQRYCAPCHGVAARGDGPVAATLSVPVPDLTGLSSRHDGKFPSQYVRDMIDGRSPVVAHGTRRMPVWGYEFWVEEGADIEAEAMARELIDRLVAYLASIQQMPLSPADPRRRADP